MKQKLWIAWGVIGLTAILSAVIGDSRIVTYLLAFISVTFGWIAFFKKTSS